MADIINFPRVLEFRKKIDDLVAERPSLSSYQAEIDEALKNAGPNPQNRLAALAELAEKQRAKLLDAAKDLKMELENAIKIQDEILKEER